MCKKVDKSGISWHTLCQNQAQFLCVFQKFLLKKEIKLLFFTCKARRPVVNKEWIFYQLKFGKMRHKRRKKAQIQIFFFSKIFLFSFYFLIIFWFLPRKCIPGKFKLSFVAFLHDFLKEGKFEFPGMYFRCKAQKKIQKLKRKEKFCCKKRFELAPFACIHFSLCQAWAEEMSLLSRRGI